jgi:hypothetical protein
MNDTECLALLRQMKSWRVGQLSIFEGEPGKERKVFYMKRELEAIDRVSELLRATAQ